MSKSVGYAKLMSLTRIVYRYLCVSLFLYSVRWWCEVYNMKSNLRRITNRTVYFIPKFFIAIISWIFCHHFVYITASSLKQLVLHILFIHVLVLKATIQWKKIYLREWIFILEKYYFHFRWNPWEEWNFCVWFISNVWWRWKGKNYIYILCESNTAILYLLNLFFWLHEKIAFIDIPNKNNIWSFYYCYELFYSGRHILKLLTVWSIFKL